MCEGRSLYIGETHRLGVSAYRNGSRDTLSLYGSMFGFIFKNKFMGLRCCPGDRSSRYSYIRIHGIIYDGTDRKE